MLKKERDRKKRNKEKKIEGGLHDGLSVRRES